MNHLLRSPYFQFFIRFGISALFIYAGWEKLKDPQSFFNSIDQFQLIPRSWITPVALGLPIFEIILGIFLWNRSSLPIARVGILILCFVFSGVVLQAWIRGITFDCGCFGSSFLSTNDPFYLLLRNSVLFFFIYSIDQDL